ncbi:hypothetical protein KSP39_PZI009535 [Platanthera zijinensis]|uniref:Uncharacterized protein n=1 Tax=Platanthera zijinensis TaxID=2320716 RepID=A0AAP0G7W7_9ASPA
MLKAHHCLSSQSLCQNPCLKILHQSPLCSWSLQRVNYSLKFSSATPISFWLSLTSSYTYLRILVRKIGKMMNHPLLALNLFFIDRIIAEGRANERTMALEDMLTRYKSLLSDSQWNVVSDSGKGHISMNLAEETEVFLDIDDSKTIVTNPY